MSLKRVVPSIPALQDVRDAVDYYADEASAVVADAFLDELQRVYELIARAPGSGSPRYGHHLDLPGLRHHRLKRYPFLIFYVERDDHIDIWRVMHGQRDIPAWLSDMGD